MGILPPIPYKVSVSRPDGLLSEPWAKFFRELFTRVGGIEALSNTELAGGDDGSSSISSLSTRVAALEVQTNDLNQDPVP